MSILSAAIEKAVEKQAYSRLFDINGQGLNQDAVLLADVLALYANGEQGALYYFTEDFAGLYQDDKGATPVTAVGQPVGLMLDRRFGLARGPELLANGNAAGSEVGWVARTNTSLSVVGGKLRVAAIGSGSFGVDFTNTPSLNSSKTYEAIAAVNTNITTLYVRVNSGTAVRVDPGYSVTRNVVVGGSGVVALASTSGVAGQYFDIEFISIRELPGNHASQATATARPTLQRDANGKLHLEWDMVDDGLLFPSAPSQVEVHDAATRTGQAIMLSQSGAGSRFIGCVATGSSSASDSAGPSPVYEVNGVVAEGTRGGLGSAWVVDTPAVVSAHSLDLSTFTGGHTGYYGGYQGYRRMFGRVFSGRVLSTEQRASVRAFLASRAGITLPEGVPA